MINTSRWKRSLTIAADHELLTCKFQFKLKQKVSQFPGYILSLYPQFSRRILGIALKFWTIYRESEKLWYKIKDILKDKCEQKMPKTKKTNESKLDVRTVEIAKKRSQSQERKNCRKEHWKVFQRAIKKTRNSVAGKSGKTSKMKTDTDK